MKVFKSIEELNSNLITCQKCPRLVKFRVEVGINNNRFKGEKFWSKPVPGFGDIEGEFLVLGLAPAPTGGNRTGRVFTGDKSAEFLMKNLFEAGFANQPFSIKIDDGLKLHNTYITAALKCVPPDNVPTKGELENCSVYLYNEIELMDNLKVVLTLGRIAFDSFKNYLNKKGFNTKDMKFQHGMHYDINGLRVYCSYHPSPRNVNTGVLNNEMFFNLLLEIREYIQKNKN